VTAAQDRSAFCCGTVALDRHLMERASQDAKRLIASSLRVKETATGAVAGYCTLAATSISANELPLEVLKRPPRYPILSAALIGRPAIDARYQFLPLATAQTSAKQRSPR